MNAQVDQFERGVQSQISPLAKQVEQLTVMVKQLFQQVRSMSPVRERVTSRSLSSSPAPAVSQRAGDCFNCGGHGHFQRECPSPRKESATAIAAQAVSAGAEGVEGLNESGSGERTDPWPELDSIGLFQ